MNKMKREDFLKKENKRRNQFRKISDCFIVQFIPALFWYLQLFMISDYESKLKNRIKLSYSISFFESLLSSQAFIDIL